tara:strand:- start:987 stop:1850 length:864 start_codon:yes stop_codon:yes gene_type:complete
MAKKHKVDALLKHIEGKHKIIHLSLVLHIVLAVVLIVLLVDILTKQRPTSLVWILGALAIVLLGFSYVHRTKSHPNVLHEKFFHLGHHYHKAGKEKKHHIYTKLAKTYHKISKSSGPEKHKKEAFNFLDNIYRKDQTTLTNAHHSPKKLHTAKHVMMVAIPGILLVATLLYLPSTLSPTGMAIYEAPGEYIPIRQTFQKNTGYGINSETPITNIALSGSIEGEGSVKIYVETNLERKLILDSSELTKKSFQNYCLADCTIPATKGLQIIILMEDAKLTLDAVHLTLS